MGLSSQRLSSWLTVAPYKCIRHTGLGLGGYSGSAMLHIQPEHILFNTLFTLE